MMDFSLAKIKKRGMELLKQHPKISSIFILLCANVFNNLVTFVVNIFLAKKLGPEIFGIFSIAVSTMMVVNFISELGLALGMVRFYNFYQKEEKKQRLILSSLFIFRTFIILSLFGISVPLGILLAKILQLDSGLQPLLSIAIMSGAILTMWIYLQNFFQAHREFSKLSRYIFAYAIFRVLCLILLYFIYTNTLNITAVLTSLYTIPVMLITLIGMIPVAIYLFQKGFPYFSNILKTVIKVLKYSKWVVVSGISYNLILRSIQFILAFRSSKHELGIFSAGLVFTAAITTLNIAVRTVFFPHVTAFEKIKDMQRHLMKIKKVFPYYTILMVISIAILAIVQVVFLGNDYAIALPVFLITSVALALTIFMGLVSMLLHTLMRPEVESFTNIGRLILVVLLVYFLAPSFGAVGSAVGYAIPVVFGELFMVFFVRKMIYETN
ncbi:MAG: lipopolysaccharide biosynthesis protein [Candidatus Hodarchaeota archaeon]